jgi:phage replication O-like protein O
MNHEIETYTKCPNYILEKLISSNLNGTQCSIVMTVLRYTNGFHRSDHQLSASFIAVASNRNRRHVNREINKLVDMKILLKVKDATRNNGRVLSINTDIGQWQIEES